MAKIAILYGTTEGQTAKIAQHLGALAAEHGHRADVLHIDPLSDDFDLSEYAGCLLGASIHEGHHQRYVERFVRARREALSTRPCGWFTVCMGIASPHPEEREEAAGFPAQLSERTGFTPNLSAVFAGALRYTQYSWLKRALMKRISAAEDGPTDTSQDFEYTDWAQVDDFARRFFELLPTTSPTSSPTMSTGGPR